MFLVVVALGKKREKNLTNKITSSAYIMCVKGSLPLLETKSYSIKSLGDKNKYCVTTCLCTMWDCTLSLCLCAAGCYSGVRKKTPKHWAAVTLPFNSNELVFWCIISNRFPPFLRRRDDNARVLLLQTSPTCDLRATAV